VAALFSSCLSLCWTVLYCTEAGWQAAYLSPSLHHEEDAGDGRVGPWGTTAPAGGGSARGRGCSASFSSSGAAAPGGRGTPAAAVRLPSPPGAPRACPPRPLRSPSPTPHGPQGTRASQCPSSPPPQGPPRYNPRSLLACGGVPGETHGCGGEAQKARSLLPALRGGARGRARAAAGAPPALRAWEAPGGGGRRRASVCLAMLAGKPWPSPLPLFPRHPPPLPWPLPQPPAPLPLHRQDLVRRG